MRNILLTMAVLALSACTGAEPKWAPDEEVARAAYRHPAPTSLTLFTVVNNENGKGGHSALLVNGSQRAMFDPAGTWYHPNLPERNDVHFGFSDPVVDFYVDYHSRITYRTVIQEVPVSPEVAELALAEIQAYGAVHNGACSKSVTDILAKLPGFESVGSTWFPNKLSEDFGKLPGATRSVVYDNDPDKNTGFVTAYGT